MGVGTWSWGNRLLFDYDPSQDEGIYEAYRAVRDAGVSIFDTADSYGTMDLNGRAEILLGQFERRYLEEMTVAAGENSKDQGLFSFLAPKSGSKVPPPQQVATKLAPYPWRVTPQSMVKSVRGSLRRLEQDKLTLAQLHWSTANYQPFQEKALWEGIADVYDEGLCEAVGVSNYGPMQFKKISEYMKDRDVPLATAQIQYSLMTYQVAKDMNKVCEEENCRLISYSPLCLGLLTGKYTLDNLPTGATNPRRQLFRELLPGAQNLLNTLEAIGRDVGKSQTQVAINWALCKDTVPITGVRTLEQATENLGAYGWKLDPAMVEELDRAAISVSKPMIQNVFQTK
jgi:pyridoxine 4-dehydrogenase